MVAGGGRVRLRVTCMVAGGMHGCVCVGGGAVHGCGGACVVARGH